VRRAAQSKTMTVYVTIGEQNLSVEVSRGERVEGLINKLQQQNPSVPARQLTYTYKDTQLQEGQQLKEYGVKNRSRVMASQ
jgi:Ubiquitin family